MPSWFAIDLLLDDGQNHDKVFGVVDERPYKCIVAVGNPTASEPSSIEFVAKIDEGMYVATVTVGNPTGISDSIIYKGVVTTTGIYPTAKVD